jgi:multimeric flavodoxin WrbA
MRILVIIGSLRKGNTLETVRKIETYHKQRSDCEYEYLFLKQSDLKLCTGCHLCMTKGEGFCPLQDDRDAIIRKMEESDGVILASPTFSMNVSWVMKNFMDRLSYLQHRPRFFRQKFMVLTVSGSYRGGKNAIQALSFAAFAGTIINRLIVFNSPGMNDAKKEKQEKKIRDEAIKFARNMEKTVDLKPSFVNIIWFSAFKAISLLYRDECQADHEFYKDKQYFLAMNLGAIRRTLIGGFTRFFTFALRKGYI